MGLESLMLFGIFFKPGEDIPLYGNPKSLPKPIGSFSDFKPASNLGLGPGIAREMPEAGNIIERIRAPGYGDKEDAGHLNYEYKVPGIKKPLTNLHLPYLFKDIGD